LTIPAEADDLGVGRELRNPRTTPGARLAALVVHFQKVAQLDINVGTEARPDDVNRVGEDRANGVIKPFHFLRPQTRDLSVGKKPRLEENLVGIGVANARDKALMGQHVFDHPPLLSKPLPEDFQRQGFIQGLRAEKFELGHWGKVVPFHQINAAHQLIVVVAQLLTDEKVKPQTGSGLQPIHFLTELEPAREHGIDDELRAGAEGDQKKFTAAIHCRDMSPLESLGEFIEQTSEDQRFGDLHFGDFDAAHLVVQDVFDDFQVREFGHGYPLGVY